MKTAAIVNPRSSGGRTARRWKSLERSVQEKLGPVEVVFTGGRGHATELARQLLLQGFERVIGVGGDGTYNEIANGFLLNDQPVRPDACLGLLPLGTGGDFQRSLGLPRDAARAIDVLASGCTREIDAGKVAFFDDSGREQTRYFVNLVSLGMGGEVAAGTRNLWSRLSGKAGFFYATLRVFCSYRGKRVDLRLDAAAEVLGATVLNVAVGNGRYHGGGMHVCPRAVFDDGLLDVTVIEDLGVVTLLKDLSYLYDGNIYGHPKCRHYRVERLTATSPERIRIEVDGEPLGSLPLEITVLPKRLKVLAPPV